MTDDTQTHTPPAEDPQEEHLDRQIASAAAHLHRIAGSIAVLKTDFPEEWETAYQAAPDPAPCREYSAQAVGTLTVSDLALEMKKVKASWGELGMYGLDDNPNPAEVIEIEKHKYAASKPQPTPF